MSKKNALLKLSAFTALLGGVFAFSDYAYKTSTVPRQHTDDSQDLDPAITKGRNFVRNHTGKTDVVIESIDSLRLHACFIPAKEDTHNYVLLIHGIWDNHECNGI